VPQYTQQQQQEQAAAAVSLLECFTAWVKLGCLHHVSMDVAEATAHVGLLHIQNAEEEVNSSARPCLLHMLGCLRMLAAAVLPCNQKKDATEQLIVSTSLPQAGFAPCYIAPAMSYCLLHLCMQVVSAALGLLTELPEFAPEQLVSTLEPHMLQVAAAAVRAASSTPPDLMHAAAWASAFAAWAAAVPQKLLAAGEDEGGGSGEVRQALLQVCLP
jgi:hypothetical protein